MSPCVPATSPHVLYMWTCYRYTRRRFECTHGGESESTYGVFHVFSCVPHHTHTAHQTHTHTNTHQTHTKHSVLNLHTVVEWVWRRAGGKGRGSSPVLLVKQGPRGVFTFTREVQQKQPLDLTHFRFESKSRTTCHRFLQSFAISDKGVPLQLS